MDEEIIDIKMLLHTIRDEMAVIAHQQKLLTCRIERIDNILHEGFIRVYEELLEIRVAQEDNSYTKL